MTVLHIITGLDDGGAEAVLYRLCKFDEKNKHIVISLMNEGKYGPLLKEIDVDVYSLEMANGKIKLDSIINLYKLIKKLKPDVVQTWMYHADLIGGIVAKLAGIKNIVWGVHHTTLVKGESKRSTILIAKINAFISKFIPKKIIYCAEKSREVQESIGFIKKKGIVVCNGYNINDFKPNEEAGNNFRSEINIDEKEFLIGHVGRYDPQKDHKNLIEGIALLDKQKISFKVVLVGSNLDNQNEILINIIREKGLENKILLLGKRNDIPNVMNGFDLFVLSSAFGEAFPNVLNEAMACGTPCITTDVGDASIIVGETGWVIPPKNPQALANAISISAKEKYENIKNWTNRKNSARNRIVENFSIEKMAESYQKVWNS